MDPCSTNREALEELLLLGFASKGFRAGSVRVADKHVHLVPKSHNRRRPARQHVQHRNMQTTKPPFRKVACTVTASSKASLNDAGRAWPCRPSLPGAVSRPGRSTCTSASRGPKKRMIRQTAGLGTSGASRNLAPLQQLRHLHFTENLKNKNLCNILWHSAATGHFVTELRSGMATGLA